MANNPQNYLIAGNDEHGVNPATAGKRTPLMPYIDRQIYENEFNYSAKNAFLADCYRIGFRVLDVKPNRQDLSVSSRVALVNRAGASAVVTFAYNAYSPDGDLGFNSVNGLEGYYSPLNRQPNASRNFAELVYSAIINKVSVKGRGVRALDVGMLSSVNCVACLMECGYMTNFREAKLMLDPDWYTQIGRASCLGVCEYFGVKYVAPESDSYPQLRLGSEGKFVRYLQFLLKIGGYSVGSVDGIFGNNTAQAVRAFQMANRITADGIVGPKTWYKLNNFTPEATLVKLGSTGAEVKYLQQKLYSKLYNTGAIDGIFGKNTERAVREFQSEFGLNPDGIVGKNTWNYIKNVQNTRPNPAETSKKE